MRFVRQVPVVTLVDDSVGLQAYMRIDALRAMLHEGGVITGAAVTLDPAAIGRFYTAVKALPAIAGVALTAVTLQNFRETMAENMYLQIFLNVMFAGIIAFGVVYNSARVSLSERERELASLRVLGFTRGEISLILLGELAVLTLLALPVGAAHRIRAGPGHHDGLQQRGVPAVLRHVAGDDRVVVSDRHRGGGRVRPPRQAAARPPRSGGGAQDAGVMPMFRLLANRRVLGSAAVIAGLLAVVHVADDGRRSMSPSSRADRWS